METDATTVITLPSDVQWVGDIGVFVVEGEWPVHGTIPGCNHILVKGCPECRYVAPEAWAQYDKLCETCDGKQRVAVWDAAPRSQGRRVSEPWLDPCPDCRDGHQVWEVRTTCRQSMTKSAGEWWLCEHCHYSMIAPALGPAPLCPGSVTARATIEVVPVVASDDVTAFTACAVADQAVVVVLGSTALLATPGITIDLKLDSLARPGRNFVVVVRK